MSSAAPPRENLWINLGCNVAAPALILTKLTDTLGAHRALILAISFPLVYGLYDLVRRRYFNVLSGLGFTSTLATGGLSLLKLDPFWFAVKEAIVPGLIGAAVIMTRHSRSSLLKAMMLNEQVVNLPKVNERLVAANRENDFEHLLDRTNWLLAGSFFFSAALNFGLARLIVTAMPETAEFNAQLGRLTWVSYVVIAVPSLGVMVFALWKMFKGIEALTGLTMEEVLHPPPAKEQSAAPPAAPPETPPSP